MLCGGPDACTSGGGCPFPASVNPPVLFRISPNDRFQHGVIPHCQAADALATFKVNRGVGGVHQPDLELEGSAGSAGIADEQGGAADKRKDCQRLVAGGGPAKEINPAATWPGVLVADSADPQALNAAALSLFAEALGELKAGRAREGAELAKLLADRLDAILDEVAALRELVPQMLAGQRAKIETRFAEMQAELDPQRLEQELVLLAQKSDVAEELDRLSTHVSEVRRVLKAGGAAGRRLDFLMQELNREANTLGSKAFDPRSTQAAVNLKVLIEQMREQVQNIE